MAELPSNIVGFPASIRRSSLTIYDPIQIGDPKLWIPAPELQELLDSKLAGMSLAGLALRTRSKVVKQRICELLGYPVPKSFKRTQPRFPGQCFDTYIQKSNNLQIWNEELSSIRRYVLIRVSDADTITRVKVVTGDALAPLDTTGTLTQKHQARCIPSAHTAELVSSQDTEPIRPFVSTKANLSRAIGPTEHPTSRKLLPISSVFKKLKKLIGKSFVDTGRDQERNRGAALHRLCCESLGYQNYLDDGQFPDIRHQLIEIKLQTAATIDLGLVCPDSTEPLDVPQIQNTQILHRDVRYAVFYEKPMATR